jgi:hypothetical protein
LLKCYTYLAEIQTNKHELRPEIEKKRVKNENRSYYAFPAVKNQKRLRGEKINIYKTLIRPVATHGAESWTES